MTTKFLTAAELAAHLRELVDDEEFIARSVRVHFPEYKREVLTAQREAAAARRAIEKAEIVRSVAAMPKTYVLAEVGEKAMRRNIEMGSESLLRALWNHHGPILHHLKLNGRQVVEL